MSVATQPDLWAARARDAGAEGSLRADPDWTERAETALLAIAATGVSFTADDVRQEVGEPPSAGALGGVFLRAAKRGWIRRVGIDHSRRLARKGAIVSRWVGSTPQTNVGTASEAAPTEARSRAGDRRERS